MKRTKVALALVVCLSVLMAVGAAGLAQQEPQEPPAPAPPPPSAPMPPTAMPGMPGMAGMMGMGQMCPGCHGMMAGMMGRSAMAIADDGIYILAGNKLMKYDRKLTLLKEVEIKMDMEKMGQMCQKCMENCPMMRGGMQGPGGERMPWRMRRRMTMQGACPMGMGCGMMAGMMERASLSVAKDGVYLLVGNKVMKYDHKLGLQKEVEIPISPAAMGQTMQQMMQNCPMMQEMQGPPGERRPPAMRGVQGGGAMEAPMAPPPPQ